MPRKWLGRSLSRWVGPQAPGGDRAQALPRDDPREHHARLALRWIADETRALAVARPLPAELARELRRCGEATETVARQIEGAREALEEVNAGRSFP